MEVFQNSGLASLDELRDELYHGTAAEGSYDLKGKMKHQGRGPRGWLTESMFATAMRRARELGWWRDDVSHPSLMLPMQDRDVYRDVYTDELDDWPSNGPPEPEPWTSFPPHVRRLVDAAAKLVDAATCIESGGPDHLGNLRCVTLIDRLCFFSSLDKYMREIQVRMPSARKELRALLPEVARDVKPEIEDELERWRGVGDVAPTALHEMQLLLERYRTSGQAR